MGIISNEYYKVLSQKMLWVVVISLFILNGYLYISQQKKVGIVLNQQYYQLEKEFAKLPPAEGLAKAEEKNTEINLIGLYLTLESAHTKEEDMKQQIDSFSAGMKPALRYEQIKEMYHKNKNYYQKAVSNSTSYYYYAIAEQFKYILGYPSFLSEMKSKASDMETVSIFSKPNTFAYRNIEKTPKDFGDLQGIPLTLGDQTGIVSSTSFDTTNLFVIAILFLLCVYLFLYEKENQLVGLIRANKRGRFPVIVAKLTVLVSLSSLLTVFFYGSILFLGKWYYGFGDLSRNLQSMSNFRDCHILLTVQQYLLLYLGTKLGVVLLTALSFALCFTWFSDTKTIYVVLATLLGSSYLGYTFIHPVSYINVLKYLNLFAFYDVYNLLSLYSNINLFGYPFDKIHASFICGLSVLFLALGITIYAYTMRYLNSVSMLDVLLRKIKRRNKKLRGTTFLFLQELYKNLIGSKVYLVILFAVVLGYQNIDQKPLLVDEDTSNYMSYIDVLKGGMTTEKKAWIQKEQDKFDQLPLEFSKISEQVAAGKITGHEALQKQAALQFFSKKAKGFERFKKQYQYLLDLEKEKHITGSFVDQLSTEYLFENGNRDLIVGVTFSILLLLCLSSIFTQDYQKGMFSILRSTVYGKTRMFVYQYVIGGLIGIALWVICYGPYYYNFYHTYQFTQWSARIQSVERYGKLDLPLTIGQLIVGVNVLQLFGVIAVVVFILGLCQLVKKQSFVILIGTVLFVFPYLLTMMKLPGVEKYTCTNAFVLYKTLSVDKAVTSNVIYFTLLFLLMIMAFAYSLFHFQRERKG